MLGGASPPRRLRIARASIERATAPIMVFRQRAQRHRRCGRGWGDRRARGPRGAGASLGAASHRARSHRSAGAPLVSRNIECFVILGAAPDFVRVFCARAKRPTKEHRRDSRRRFTASPPRARRASSARPSSASRAPRLPGPSSGCDSRPDRCCAHQHTDCRSGRDRR